MESFHSPVETLTERQITADCRCTENFCTKPLLSKKEILKNIKTLPELEVSLQYLQFLEGRFITDTISGYLQFRLMGE